ncbi:carbon starvation CstA family protein, partial [Salmonella enterica]
MTIPISMVVGIWHKLTGNLQAASWVGFIAVLACVFFGPYVQESAFGAWLTLRAETISLALPVYAFF